MTDKLLVKTEFAHEIAEILLSTLKASMTTNYTIEITFDIVSEHCTFIVTQVKSETSDFIQR